jgi:hypothetical protein
MPMQVAGLALSQIASIQVPHNTVPTKLPGTGQRAVLDGASPTILGVIGLLQCTGLAIYYRPTRVRGMLHFGPNFGGELETGDPQAARRLSPKAQDLTTFLQDLTQRGAVLNAVEMAISGGLTNDSAQLLYNRLQRVEPTLPFGAMVMFQGGQNFYLMPDGSLANALVVLPRPAAWRAVAVGPGAMRIPNISIGDR